MTLLFLTLIGRFRLVVPVIRTHFLLSVDACAATLKGWSLVLYGTVTSHPGLLIRRLSSRQVRIRASDRHQRAPLIYSRSGSAISALPMTDCLIFNCLLCVYSAWLSLLAAAHAV